MRWYEERVFSHLRTRFHLRLRAPRSSFPFAAPLFLQMRSSNFPPSKSRAFYSEPKRVSRRDQMSDPAAHSAQSTPRNRRRAEKKLKKFAARSALKFKKKVQPSRQGIRLRRTTKLPKTNLSSERFGRGKKKKQRAKAK